MLCVLTQTQISPRFNFRPNASQPLHAANWKLHQETWHTFHRCTDDTHLYNAVSPGELGPLEVLLNHQHVKNLEVISDSFIFTLLHIHTFWYFFLIGMFFSYLGFSSLNFNPASSVSSMIEILRSSSCFFFFFFFSHRQINTKISQVITLIQWWNISSWWK